MYNEDFFGLIPGSFGKIYFKYDKSDSISQKYKEQYIDNFSNEAMHAFIKDGILNPNKEQLSPEVAFMKAREDAKNYLEQSKSHKFYALEFQIGNKECMKEIEKLEKDIKFLGWADPGFIDLIKLNYKDGKQNKIYPI